MIDSKTMDALWSNLCAVFSINFANERRKKRTQSATNEMQFYLLLFARNIKLERLEFETKRQQCKSQADCIYITDSVAMQFNFLFVIG